MKKEFSINETQNVWISVNDLGKILNKNNATLRIWANEYRKDHPEWFDGWKLHPNLVDVLSSRAKMLEISLTEHVPQKGWLTLGAIAEKLNTRESRIKDVIDGYRISHPQYFDVAHDSKTKLVREFFHPDLISIVENEIQKFYPVASSDWVTIANIAEAASVDFGTIKNRIPSYLKEHPEWYKILAPRGSKKDKNGNTINLPSKTGHDYYHSDLLKKIVKDINTEKTRVVGWTPIRDFAKESNIDISTIESELLLLDKEYPELMTKPKYRGDPRLMHPLIREKIAEFVKNLPPVASDGEMTGKELGRLIGTAGATAQKRAEKYRLKHPEWFVKRRIVGGAAHEHFTSDLVLAVVNDVLGGMDKAPKEWTTIGRICLEFGLEKNRVHYFVRKLIEEQRFSHPEWFKYYLDRTANFPTEHVHVDLVGAISAKLREYKIEHDLKTQTRVDSQIEKKLVIELENLKNNESGFSKDFRTLVSVFGASRAIDILFKFRPEFKDLPIERVRSCLAAYLGDFLSAKQEFRIKDIGAAAEFLSETTLREGLYETMKDHCLQYYFEKRRQGATGDSYEIIYNYLVHITDELHGVSNKFLDDVIEDVVSYFNSAIQEFKKPEKFVDRLSEDREFPDLNQRINMKELADKKRMLIADEMGLGKSASVIMAKENLRLGCALVIVPKIVQQTWQDYLSDDIARKGYFKKGQAPRVLVVDGVKDLEGVSKKDFDYIIISQAKLNGRYAPLLENLDPDMLIVDESHKLKNGKGVHTNVLLPLARKLEGEGKYLAMLTGTPIPNKVNDIAVALKLLYPDQFGETPISELTATIIKGDLIDLRSLLVPRMQMKELKDVIEMPEREQKIASISLSPAERDVYEALLELDEITAFEKMKALRTFLLNPALVDVEPGIRSSKFEALQNKLTEAYKTKSKVLVVVNDYVTGVMRGKEFLFQQLQLPPDVSVEFIHGDDGSQSNKNIRPDLQRRFNETSEKMLLIVNGAAADVGISLVGAEETIIYNEPWTESDLMQQKARVFRQGLDHPITETTLLVRDSIEEGLHEYIAKKHKAVEKILKGIPISELEMRMVENAEKNKDGDISEEDYEVNPELARHYFSVKHRLLLMFAHIKQRGEVEIRKFFETWGAEYAQGYREVGARSVQANANRVAGALISEMITVSGRHPAALQILDVASGPEMLRRHCADILQPSITSLDINKHHFESGTLGKTFVGGWTAMPFKDRTFDYLNCAMAFQDSEFVPSKNKYERLDVLREMNRVLQPGGRVVINMIYSMEMNDMEKFRLFVEAIGFKIVTDFTGIADFEDQYYSQVVTLEKIADSEKKSEEVVAEIGIEHRVGLKMHKIKKTLRNDRKILKYGFYLNGKSKPILLNSADQKVSHEENMIEDEIAKLKKVYKTIREIPVQEIIDRGYVRISLSKKYYLFKRLTTAPGIVLLK